MNNKILSVLCCFFLVAGAYAQPYCNVRTFTLRDGLAANTISGFTQTKNGLMWFSTWNGLCCYDGYRFTTFRNEPGVSEILTTNRILMVKTSASGDVWCCTYDRHLYLFDTQKCRFINVSEMINRRFGHQIEVRNIYSLSNGYTWIVSSDAGPNYRIDDSKIKGSDGIEQFDVKGGRIRNNSIKKVELDQQGREWIFMDGTIALLGDRKCDFGHHPYEYQQQLGQRVVLVATDGHIAVYEPGRKQPVIHELPWASTTVYGIRKWDDSRVLLATGQGLVIFHAVRGVERTVSVVSPAQPSPEAIACFIDSKQRIWVFTGGDGVVRVDSRDWHTAWLTSKASNAMMQTNSLQPLFHEDEYGTLWMIPKGGTFCYYDEDEERLVPYVLRASGRSDVYFPTINKFGFDKENNLWFTETRDVTLVNFKYHHFKFIPVVPNLETRSVMVDRNGRTWAGSSDGYLVVFDGRHRLLGYVNGQGRLQREAVRFSERIYALREDEKGRVWIGTKGSGVYVISPNSGVQHFMHSPSNPYSVSHNDIYDIDFDSKGHVWIATYERGLNLVDEQGGSIRFINCNNLLRHYPIDKFSKIRRITHTSGGVVMLSTNNGFITFSDRFDSPGQIHFYTSQHIPGDTASLMSNDVMQTLVSSTGRIYVVTLGGGVQQLESENLLRNNHLFRSIDITKPADGMVQSLIEDNKGNLWIVREGSIDQYHPSTGEIVRYGPNNLGDNVELTEAKPVYDVATNQITVGVRGGILTFNPQHLKKSGYKPDIVFTGVLYQGENKMEPLFGADRLEVPSDRRNLTVYFAAIEYSDKYLVRYAYMLEGVDQKWNYVGASNSASFNRLPAGHYRLLVKSTNNDGVWSDNVQVLDIYAHPTFWETIWAKLLYLLVCCGIIYVVVYIYHLRNKAEMERQLSGMKTAFFTDVSHKLRTPLTLIGGPVAEVLQQGGLSDVARSHLEMVKRNSGRMLELVNKMLKYSMEHGVYISDDNVAYRYTQEAGGLLPSGMASDVEGGAAAHAGKKEGERTLTLLVVEDNDDLRSFLYSILSGEYRVLLAENGQEGLEMAEREMPDFIITDVMMPVMDGLAMVHRIKQNNDICHIPIIVLSAKASLEDRLQGLKEGIDDYITKPFSALYLKSRVHNIISQRQMLQQAYLENLAVAENREADSGTGAERAAQPVMYKLETPQIVDADKEMMKQLLAFLEEHIDDANLKIEDLADAVRLGRSVFYGKIKSMVGMTPVDFVRHIRMQRAEELIAKSNYPFSQIAYMVGFSDPKYFSKCFKKETGMTPSEYREKA